MFWLNQLLVGSIYIWDWFVGEFREERIGWFTGNRFGRSLVELKCEDSSRVWRTEISSARDAKFDRALHSGAEICFRFENSRPQPKPSKSTLPLFFSKYRYICLTTNAQTYAMIFRKFCAYCFSENCNDQRRNDMNFTVNPPLQTTTGRKLSSTQTRRQVVMFSLQ